MVFYIFVKMKLKDSIFNIKTEKDFKRTALEIFKYQYNNNRVYRSYCDLLCINHSEIKEVNEIPFLPIQFFKSHKVVSNTSKEEIIFTSSGTTSSVTSSHFVSDVNIYIKSFKDTFNKFYGNIEDYTVLALLPSYLERNGSSLIYMVNHLIKDSKKEESGFFLNNLDELAETLNSLENKGRKTILIGVSFALLDFIEKHKFNLKHTIVMETGGMKGRRKEIIRTELHRILKNGFGVKEIHSEYGMTELLSQAYSTSKEIYTCPPWMKVLTRDPYDPFTILDNKSGGLNIIDLANINSCSFIATQDLGSIINDNQFKVIGRFDNSDIRGCNLMSL